MDARPPHPLRLHCGAGAPPSRGRLHPESLSPTRTEYQRDRDRIIHCGAFRRLALKTQVFLPGEDAGYRTRLTHTIEVAQIARSIARVLGLDEDLTEALSLAHDLGHPPFGHTGEDALDEALAADGGFDHNAQTLRVVTCLERRYPDFDGLNLTIETLEGLTKRNGPLVAAQTPGGAVPAVPGEIAGFAARHGIDLRTWPGFEAQVAAVADDIAYNAHDLEDGLDAGLFDLSDLKSVPILAEILDGLARSGRSLDDDLTVRALARTMIGLFVEDVVATSTATLPVATPGTRGIASTPRLQAASDEVKAFLRERMYQHPRLLAVRRQAHQIVTDLATHFIAVPADLPEGRGAGRAAEPGSPASGRTVADYLAGLSDTGAIGEHRRLFASTPDLR